MENLDKNSKPYLTGDYDEMFKAAELASMANEEIVAYRNSILQEMERESEIQYAKEEGIQIGEERGIQIGEERGILATARRMKERGMNLGDIMLYTGLSEEQISNL